ncbi:hypothetical protein JYT79_03330 [Cardiobacterium sp. AH-315-I02]|nr:hypothetical protein [Cardiobacterium sp. AH-315-I02]
MKASIKIQFVIILLIPFLLGTSLYFLSLSFEENSNDIPPKSAFELAEKSQDIEELRVVLTTSLHIIENNNKDYIDLFFSFADVLFAIAFLNASLLYSIYLYARKKTSNK